ncbi:MAG: hypothetical protein RBS87_03050 [Acholeplasma sp.]|jgi:hypothetical protein|nr:hypothetical protein [Acholeplasma sp.]
MSKKPYARPQYKVKPAVIIIIAVIVFVFSALIVIIQPSDQEKIYKAYNSAGSPNLSQNHVIESISVSKLGRLIDSGAPVVVFFGTTTCSVCVSEIGWYDIEFKGAGLVSELSVIYYVNRTNMSDSDVEKFQTKYAMTLTGTPELYYLNDGDIVARRSDFNSDTQPMAGQIRSFFTAVKNDLAE